MAEAIDGHRALALGLVNRAVPAADVLPQALELAERVAGWDPAAMGLTKRAFHRCADLALEDALGVGRDANIIMRGFRQGAAR
ncbi:enoyl-CoA hydratase [compost metagenome]